MARRSIVEFEAGLREQLAREEKAFADLVRLRAEAEVASRARIDTLRDVLARVEGEAEEPKG